MADYLFGKDRIFAALNLAPDELALYDNVYRLLDAQMPRPNLVVYIRVNAEVLIERLRKRNRDFERYISVQYIERAYRRRFAIFLLLRREPLAGGRYDRAGFRR